MKNIQLNKNQELAVKHQDGPIMVIAGAGTGKTAVITQRVIELVKNSSKDGQEILALTFTDKAAAEMTERVDIAMPLGYNEVTISTFHAFCDQLLRDQAVKTGLNPDYELMTQSQSYIFFKRMLFDLPLDLLRPIGNPTENIRAILQHFSRLQDECITPQQYIDVVSELDPDDLGEDYVRRAVELSESYKIYREKKLESSKLDFGDLITEAISLLKSNPSILADYHERFRYILVDEFQDTNKAQNILINLLALGKDPGEATEKDLKDANLMVVGDDDQAIYQFRGAALSNITQFKDMYPMAKEIVLVDNYRSGQEILDAAYRLIQYNNPDRLESTLGLDKKLISHFEDSTVTGSPVRTFAATGSMDEAENIVKEILRITGNSDLIDTYSTEVGKRYDSQGQGMFVDMDKGDGYECKFQDIGILVRANSHADDTVHMLQMYGVPYKYTGPKGLYSRPEVLKLISSLRLLVNPKDDLSCYSVLQMECYGLTPRDLMSITQRARKAKLSIFELFEQEFSIKIGELSDLWETDLTQSSFELSKNGVAGVDRFVRNFDEALKLVHTQGSIGKVLYTFFKESGYMDEFVDSSDQLAHFKAQNIGKFFEIVKRYESENEILSIGEFVDFLDFSISVGDSPSVDTDILDDYDAVSIMTVHGAKGLEFPTVFLPSLVSGRFPGTNRRERLPLPDELHDSAQKDHISEERRLFYVAITRAKSRLYLTASKSYASGKRVQKPSPFVSEALDKKVMEELFAEPTVQNDSDIETLSITTDSKKSLKVDAALSYIPTNISYTHIDTYENCPKKFKYRYLLGLQTPSSAAQSFGKSVHGTLRDLYSGSISKEVDPLGKDELKGVFNENWIREGYESPDHEKLRKEFGLKKVNQFYDTFYATDYEKVVEIEKPFKYRVGDVVVKGFIDRIDRLDDGSFEVIDYKTGKERAKKEVEKNLQLVLYAMAAQKLFGYEVSLLSLIFVEHGVKISVELDRDRYTEVIDRIGEVVDRINSGDFEATPGYLCNFCEYREICDDVVVI